VPVSVNLDKVLDKQYENTTRGKIPDAPELPDLYGVTGWLAR
jgi:hypothetical protein